MMISPERGRHPEEFAGDREPRREIMRDPIAIAERWESLVEIAGRNWQDACDCGQSTHKVKGEDRCAVWAYGDDIRAYGLAVLAATLELRAYTCSATCDHHEDYCPRPHVKALRAEIEGG